MLKLVPKSQFKRDLKRCKKRGKDLNYLNEITKLLKEKKPLPAKNEDHPLTGNWSDYRECHIKSDWVLIYQVTKQDLILVRTGTHSDLFKK